ncbi:MAG TPA: hypothetical protein VMT00_06615 [Thermoanaerobaculia bacterium]|nr:hypothetical protein [Thermoanaerobaculia bacterium]
MDGSELQEMPRSPVPGAPSNRTTAGSGSSTGRQRRFAAPFLVCVILASVVPYVAKLGFYGDDWSFLAAMRYGSGESISDLVSTLLETRAGKDLRFVQGILLAVPYKLFGMEPFGYHLVIALLLVVTGLLAWMVLEELTGSRAFSLATALIYLLLPHYSTDRFWIAAIQVPASMAFYLLSVYCILRLLRPVRHRTIFFVIAGVSIVLSGFSYETALPLALLGPGLVWIASRRREPRSAEQSVKPAFACSVVVLMLAMGVLASKATVSERVSGSGSFASQAVENARHALGTDHHPASHGLALRRAFVVGFGLYGVLLPESAADAWQAARFRPANLIALLVVLAAIVAGLWLAASQHVLPPRSTLLLLIAVGLLIFLFGYAVFLFNRGVMHTPTGVGNRTAMAAAFGAALVFAATLALVASSLASRLRALFFAATVAAVCAFGLMTTLAISVFWIDARDQAETVLQAIESARLPLEPGSTLIVGGFCPYAGPAIVFDAPWDLEAALRLRLGMPGLRADVVTARMAVEDEGLVSNVAYRELHRYSERLLHFDVSSRGVLPLDSHEAAASILADARYRGCGISHPSVGVPILKRDRFPSVPLVLLAVQPSVATVGEPFNVQPDGRSAFIARCLGADPGTRVTLNGFGLPSVFGSAALLSAVMPAGFLDRPGTYEVRLDNGYTVSNALPFVVE